MIDIRCLLGFHKWGDLDNSNPLIRKYEGCWRCLKTRRKGKR